jgi:hypothetical protein
MTRWASGPFLLSDGMAVALIGIGLLAMATGLSTEPGSLVAVGLGALAVSVLWRLNAWLSNRYARGVWPFEPGRPFWRRRTRT